MPLAEAAAGGTAAADTERRPILDDDAAPAGPRGGDSDASSGGDGDEATIQEPEAAVAAAPPPPPAAPPPLFPLLRERGVLPVYALALLHYAAGTLSLPVLVTYLNERGWTSDSDLTVYTAAYVLGVVVPFLGNPAVTLALKRWGLRATLNVVQLVALLGFGVCALGDNEYAFIVGWSLAGSLLCLRSVRQAAIAAAVPPAARTQAMALHGLCVPLGGMVGAGLTRAIVGACDGCTPDLPRGLGQMTEHTLCFAASGALVLFSAAATLCAVRPPPPPPPGGGAAAKAPAAAPPAAGGEEAEDAERRVVRVTLESGREVATTPRAFTFRVLAAFCVMFGLGSFASNFCTVAVQPLLVNKLHYSSATVSDIYLVTMAASTIPAALIIPLTRRVPDRAVMVVGAVLKLAGACLLLAPPVDDVRVIAGFILVSKSTFFFFSCGLSLFSKVLGRRCLGLPFGVLLSAVAAANAAGTAASGAAVGRGGGELWLLAFAAPALLSLLLLLAPLCPLDPAHPVAAKVAAVKN